MGGGAHITRFIQKKRTKDFFSLHSLLYRFRVLKHKISLVYNLNDGAYDIVAYETWLKGVDFFV
jgi:hypothetical protein